MTQNTTNLIPVAGLEVGSLANWVAKAPGSIVLEQFTGNTAAAPPGIGMLIPYNDGEGLLPFTPWSSLNLQPGELYALHGETGIRIPEVEVSAEIDITLNAPDKIARPTGPRAPALTVKAGKPLILAVQHPSSAQYRTWVGFELNGAPEPYFASGNDTVVFDQWILVLTIGAKRIEIRIG